MLQRTRADAHADGLRKFIGDQPLGIRFNGDGFKSEFAAKLADEKALRELLDGLTQEGNV